MLHSVERIFVYCGCRVAFYRINYISLSLSKFHSIMLNNIRHVTTSKIADKYKMVAKQKIRAMYRQICIIVISVRMIC